MARNHKKAKASQFTKAEAKLIAQSNALLAPHDCKVIGLGANAVGVLGDARAVGVSVIIGLGDENVDISTISNLVTNRVKGVTRVLLNVPPPSPPKKNGPT